MQLLDVPEGAPPAVKRAAVQKNPHIVDFFFCRRVEKAVSFLLKKAMLADWVWYRYEFQMRGSVHAHGMMKLKLSPDILNLVSRVYSGRKAIEMLQCAVEYDDMSAAEKEEFREASLVDEAILKAYNQCIAATELSPEDITTMNDRVTAGIEAETKVIRFHKWIITTMNDDFPSVETLNVCADEQQLKTLTRNLKLLLGQIAIKIALEADHQELLLQKEELQSQVSALHGMMARKKREVEAEHGNIPVAVPHPCCADWNNTRNSQEHYNHLKFVQRHKCVGTYCLRRRKRADGAEFGEPYCRFSFPLDFQWTWRIEFIEMDNGGVRANFLSKRNDPRMNQHCKMHLQSWMANCDLQIVLDEEQAVLYLVKYASKGEKSSTDMSDILQSLVPLNENVEQSDGEADESIPVGGQVDDIAGPTIIRKVALKSVGIRNKTQQEIFHLLMQEALSHSDFTYIKIHLDKHNVRAVNSNNSPDQPAFYPNIFDFYASRQDGFDMSFLNFCRRYELKKGELTERRGRAVILTYPAKSGDRMSRYYHLYCKYFLIKHKPWHGNVNNAWGGPILDPEPNDNENEDGSYLEDDENSFVKIRYVDQFRLFQQTTDTAALEVVNGDVDRL